MAETASTAQQQVAFIKQEALEKAREIKVKADEEFAIEKVRDLPHRISISPAMAGSL